MVGKSVDHSGKHAVNVESELITTDFNALAILLDCLYRACVNTDAKLLNMMLDELILTGHLDYENLRRQN